MSPSHRGPEADDAICLTQGARAHDGARQAHGGQAHMEGNCDSCRPGVLFLSPKVRRPARKAEGKLLSRAPRREHTARQRVGSEHVRRTEQTLSSEGRATIRWASEAAGMPLDRSPSENSRRFCAFVAPAVRGPLGGRDGLRAVSRGDRSVGCREEGLSEVYLVTAPAASPRGCPIERGQSPEHIRTPLPCGEGRRLLWFNLETPVGAK